MFKLKSQIIKQNDKPGYVVGRSSIQTCCRQQAQATYLKRDGQPHRFFSVLLRMGFTGTPSVTRRPVSSYLTFPPLPDESGGIFLLHFPWSHLHRTLSGILPCEARTFLTASLSSETARSFVGLAFLIVSKFILQVKYFFYLKKQLPPINSRSTELFGTAVLSVPIK